MAALDEKRYLFWGDDPLVPRAPALVPVGIPSMNGHPAPVTAPAPCSPRKSVQEEYKEEKRADLDWLLFQHEQSEKPIAAPKAPNLEWIRDPRSRESARLVLELLMLSSELLKAEGEDGTVIYAVDWVGLHLGIAGETVSRALRRLESAGLIELVKELPDPNPFALRRPTRVWRPTA